MCSVRVTLFTIILSVCLLITASFPYEIYHPPPRMPANMMPIMPMNVSAMHTANYKLPPINPDAESIFLPLNSKRYRPEQIMERISLNGNKQKKKIKNKNNFDYLNFDTYMVKPAEYNYNRVLLPIKPESLKTMNRSDSIHHYIEPAFSLNNHRPHHKGSKMSKKNKKHAQLTQFKDYDDFHDFFDHPRYVPIKKTKHASSAPRKSSKHSVASISKLPIGITFFETSNEGNVFPSTIAFTSKPVNPMRKAHTQDTSASNPQSQSQAYHSMKGDDETRAAYNARHEEGDEEENYPNFDSFKHFEDRVASDEANNNHNQFMKAPEMFKFTLDDVVVRPYVSNKHKENLLVGPVTLAPYSDDTTYFVDPQDEFSIEYVNDIPSTHTENYPPSMVPTNKFEDVESEISKQTLRPNKNRVSKFRYRKVESKHFTNPKTASLGQVSRHFQSFESNSGGSSPSQKASDAYTASNIAIDSTVESTQPHSISSFSTKPRDNYKKYTTTPTTVKKRPRTQRKDLSKSLEVSSSYTKRRTQGYNSVEEPSTTPISVPKTTTSNYNDEMPSNAACSQRQNKRATPKAEQAKYFQDILTEQLTPYRIDYGHLTENPSGWEERYERKDLRLHRHQGKVKWGDKKGGFGEHYYDLNHHLPVQPDSYSTIGMHRR